MNVGFYTMAAGRERDFPPCAMKLIEQVSVPITPRGGSPTRIPLPPRLVQSFRRNGMWPPIARVTDG